MIPYNPSLPLISLHVPKCAGQSLRIILNNWFKENLFFHYFKQKKHIPVKHELKAKICIHGHFNNEKKFGVLDYYPQVKQYITFIRDPLEIGISNYFFWKRKARDLQLKLGKINEGGEHDYRNIDDFFVKRPQSHISNFLPANLTRENFREELDKKFVYIGIVEDMKTTVKILSERLGFKIAEETWINKSDRDETLSPQIQKKFIADNSFAYEIYSYALKIYK